MSTSLHQAEQKIVSDISYISKYIAMLAPTVINAHVLLAGGSLHIPANYTYVELGCGSGFTLCHLAKANPTAYFVGVDVIAVHIAQAKTLASQLGLRNVQFFEADFRSPQLNVMPRADYIVCHGVFSWVSDAVRDAIANIVEAKLKPGGLLYLSYNAYPGFHPLDPIKALFRMAASEHASSLERIRAARAFLQRATRASIAAIDKNPQLRAYCDFLLKQDDRYLAHEFLGENTAFYFQQMHAFWHARGLQYRHCVDHQREISRAIASHAQYEFIHIQSCSITQTQLWDYCFNTHFRRDIYQKPLCDDARPNQNVWLASLHSHPFTPAQMIVHEGKAIAQTCERYHTVGSILARCTQASDLSINTVIEQAQTMGVSVNTARQALSLFLASGQISLLKTPPRTPEQVCLYHWCHDNDVILQQAIDNRSNAYLSSPVLGAPFVVDANSAILLKAVCQVLGDADAVHKRWRSRRDAELMRLDQYDDQQFKQALTHTVTQVLLQCQRLGVLE